MRVLNFAQAMSVLETIELPVKIRAAFALGGAGSGIAHTRQEYEAAVKRGLAASPTSEILITKETPTE